MERQKSEDRGRSEKDEHRGKRRLRHRTSNVQVSEDSDIEWEGTDVRRQMSEDGAEKMNVEHRMGKE
jgi:hypothetical protein